MEEFPIATKIGGVPFRELIRQLMEWSENHLQSIQPGKTSEFSREGEFHIPGSVGMLKIKVKITGLRKDFLSSE